MDYISVLRTLQGPIFGLVGVVVFATLVLIVARSLLKGEPEGKSFANKVYLVVLALALLGFSATAINRVVSREVPRGQIDRGQVDRDQSDFEQSALEEVKKP